MNVEFRIAKLERLLSDVTLRRARLLAIVPPESETEKAVAGWNGLERNFRAALTSAERQRGCPEVSLLP